MTASGHLSSEICRALRFRDSIDQLLPFSVAEQNILLDLALSRIVGRSVSIRCAAIASRTAYTTAHRAITQLLKAGMIERRHDRNDGRRVFLVITDEAFAQVEALFAPLQLVRAA